MSAPATPTRPPAAVLVLAGLAVGVVLLPLLGMLASVPWGSFLPRVASPAALAALRLSVLTSLCAAAIATVLGVPLALMLERGRFPGRRPLRTLVLLPLVLPPVVGGLALLATFGRRSPVGAALAAAGMDLAFTSAAVVLAQVFVSLPFVVLTMEGALRSAGVRHETAAAGLGAPPGRILLRVTLPSVRPGIVTGAVLAFARSLGEFGATITFAGSLAGVTRTLPLEIYLARETDPGTAASLSVLLMGVALVTVAAVYRPARGGRGAGARAWTRDPSVPDGDVR